MIRKPLVALIVAIILICSVIFGSCSIESGRHFTAVTFTGKTQEGSPITYDFDEQLEQEFVTLMDECDKLVAADENYPKFSAAFDRVETLYKYLVDAQMREELLFHMYYKIENLEKYNYFSQLNTVYDKWHRSILKNIAEGSFRQYYFADKTDEEIEKVVGKNYPDEYYVLKNEIDDIDSANSLLDSYDPANYADIENLYVRFVSTANAFAEIGGYENYQYYTYENIYGRDYTPADTDDFYDYVKTYVIPAYKAAKAEYKRANNALNKKEKKTLNDFFDYRVADIFLDGFDDFYAYKKALGGSFETVFDDLWREGGAFYISYEDTVMTAYQEESPLTKKSLVFFGKNCHGPLAVVHEFGHYFAAEAGLDSKDFDLSETQSQANEALYMNYLSRYGRYSRKIADVMSKYHVYSMLNHIVKFTLVNEFEKLVYSDDDFAIGEAEKYVEALREDIGDCFDDFELDTYWYKVVIAQAGYYISYSTSLVGSYNVYCLAQDDFSGAVDAYLKLVDYSSHGVKANLESVYEYAGLKNVFSEQTFIDLFGSIGA